MTKWRGSHFRSMGVNGESIVTDKPPWVKDLSLWAAQRWLFCKSSVPGDSTPQGQRQLDDVPGIYGQIPPGAHAGSSAAALGFLALSRRQQDCSLRVSCEGPGFGRHVPSDLARRQRQGTRAPPYLRFRHLPQVWQSRSKTRRSVSIGKLSPT